MALSRLKQVILLIGYYQITYYVYIIDYTNLICGCKILINLNVVNVTNIDRMLDLPCFWGEREAQAHILQKFYVWSWMNTWWDSLTKDFISELDFWISVIMWLPIVSSFLCKVSEAVL